MNGHEVVIKLLLATGKDDLNSKDEDGRTPLAWAAANSHLAAAGMLLATERVDVALPKLLRLTCLSTRAACKRYPVTSDSLTPNPLISSLYMPTRVPMPMPFLLITLTVT